MGDGIKRNVLNYWEHPQDPLKRDNKLVIGGSAEQEASSNFILNGSSTFNGTSTYNGIILQNPGSTFDLNGTVLMDGTFKLGQDSTFKSDGKNNEGVIDLPSSEFIGSVIDTMCNGLVTCDNLNFFGLVSFHPTNPALLSILGGVVQFVDDSLLGQTKMFRKRWQAIPNFNPGVPDGNYIVAIDRDGVVTVIDNSNSSDLTPRQYLDYVQIGTFSLGGGEVVTAFGLAYPTANKDMDNYQLKIALGSFNYAQKGYRLEPKTGTLQIIQRDGFSFNMGGGIIDHRITDESNLGFDIDPIPLVALVDPVTGTFVFSGTSSIDPLKISKSGTVLSVSNAGGGNIAVNTQLAHGLLVGDPVTLRGMQVSSYNGTSTILAKTSAQFTIAKPYAGTSTGLWSGLTAVSNNQFTAQRCFLYPTSFVIAVYYGQREYGSVDAFRAAGGQNAELFIEPFATSTAMQMDLIVVQKECTNLANIAQCQFIRNERRIR